MKRLVPVILVLWLLLPGAAAAETLSGVVVGIKDGDSLAVRVGGRRVWVRIYGVDCPEGGQAYGRRAREYTTRLALGRTVRVLPVTRDKYGRVVAGVILPSGGRLGADLIRAGLAWWYRWYAPHDREFEALEAEARAKRRGLWAEDDPTPPWVWRRMKK